METTPDNNNEKVEPISEYEEKRDAGIADAKARIDAIPHFENLDYRGKFAALRELLNELAAEEDSYYASEYVGAQMRSIEANEAIGSETKVLEEIDKYYSKAG